MLAYARDIHRYFIREYGFKFELKLLKWTFLSYFTYNSTEIVNYYYYDLAYTVSDLPAHDIEFGRFAVIFTAYD